MSFDPEQIAEANPGILRLAAFLNQYVDFCNNLNTPNTGFSAEMSVEATDIEEADLLLTYTLTIPVGYSLDPNWLSVLYPLPTP